MFHSLQKDRYACFLIVLQSLLVVDLFLGWHSLVLIAAINERSGSSLKENGSRVEIVGAYRGMAMRTGARVAKQG